MPSQAQLLKILIDDLVLALPYPDWKEKLLKEWVITPKEDVVPGVQGGIESNDSRERLENEEIEETAVGSVGSRSLPGISPYAF
jgi:hypothetical protein